MFAEKLRQKFRTWWTLAFSGIVTAGIMAFLLVSPAGAQPVQLSGNVSDQQGNGISNAEVRVLTPVIPPVPGYFTDSSGDYVTDILSDIYDIQVIPSAGSGFQGETLEDVSIPGNTVINFVLARFAFAVNSTTDAIDVNPGDGVCATSTPGTCTLRAAIMEADLSAPTISGILLPAGTYNLSLAGAGEDASLSGDLDINDFFTITGDSQASTIIDGSALDPVFHVRSGFALNLSEVTVQGGTGDGTTDGGGGILIDMNGTLTLTDSTVSGNTSNGNGGGIGNRGTLTLTESTVSGNNVPSGGLGSLSSDNGGGIYNSGTLTLTDSTVNGNSATLGGDIYSFGASATLTLTGSTVNDNVTSATAPSGSHGGGIFDNEGTTIAFQDTIIAGNTAGIGPDCAGFAFSSLGRNLVGDGTGCPSSGVGGLTGSGMLWTRCLPPP